MHRFREGDDLEDLGMQFAQHTGGLGFYPEGNWEWRQEQSNVYGDG